MSNIRAIAPVPLPLIFTGYGILPAARSTREQTGEWQLTPAGPATIDVRWTYTFRSRWFALPAVRLMVARLWRGYANQALALTRNYVEHTGGRLHP